ncbi:DUF2470 domain-containing protein [Peterkaempfera sp. SMS 1(5)a]|uniref:DUF2470 domain-containing protein n=1 Tax=Peterkaempfera podocarpi TaxID=3232308 RepID=UPI00366E49E7
MLLSGEAADVHAMELAAAPRGQAATTIDITDVAAAPVRDRVRARLALGGWISVPADTPGTGGRTVLSFDPAMIALQTDGQVHPVGLDEFALAEADPVATHEAGLLTHLADQHADIIAALTRQVGARHLLGVVRAHPLRLDRFGIVLRIERARTHHDVRLPFETPLDHPADTGRRIQEILTRTHMCPRHRTATGPGNGS